MHGTELKLQKHQFQDFVLLNADDSNILNKAAKPIINQI